MHATLSQSDTLTTATDPKVIYDPVNMTITATVIVSLPPGAGDITITTAPITIPKDTWTLFWDLVVDTPEINAWFADPGIIFLPPLPPKVTVIEQPSGGPVRWTAVLKNEVVGVNAFNYDIAVAWSTNVSEVLAHTTVHDPTIVVTKDPIG
jgi:hypothetical protein